MPIDKVSLDKICDYIPFVSSYTNIVDLIKKKRFEVNESPKLDPPSLKEKYITYIENKSEIRCAILIIPVIGNALVGIYDLANAFISLFRDEEEAPPLKIGAPTDFKHVSGSRKKSTDEEKAIIDSSSAEFKDLEERIDEKGEFLLNADKLNAKDIYSNTLEVPATKLEYIPARDHRAYLTKLGFTPAFYADNDHFAEKKLGSLSRGLTSYKREHDPNLSETEYLEKLRRADVEDVMKVIIDNSKEERSAIFMESFLEFLLLDHRLTFDKPINKNISQLAAYMIELDNTLEARLKPLVISS